MNQTCNECEKLFASSQSLKRHMDKFHTEDEDMDDEGDVTLIFPLSSSWNPSWLSDQDSRSGDEDDDEVVDTENGVETIGEFIKEAIEDVEDEVQSLEDLFDVDTYKKICRAVEEKVLPFATHYE